MYTLDKFDKSKFQTTMYRTSKDDNNRDFLLDDKYNIKVYSFDSIKRFVCKKLRGGNELSSCDAYYKNYIIEFKNCNYQNIDKAEIRMKAFDSCSILLYSHLVGSNVFDIQNTHTLIVVYNDEKNEEHDKEYGMSNGNSVFKLYENLSALSSIKPKRTPNDLGLDTINGILYKDIYVMDKKEFINAFLEFDDDECKFVPKL